MHRGSVLSALCLLPGTESDHNHPAREHIPASPLSDSLALPTNGRTHFSFPDSGLDLIGPFADTSPSPPSLGLAPRSNVAQPALPLPPDPLFGCPSHALLPSAVRLDRPRSVRSCGGHERSADWPRVRARPRRRWRHVPGTDPASPLLALHAHIDGVLLAFVSSVGATQRWEPGLTTTTTTHTTRTVTHFPPLRLPLPPLPPVPSASHASTSSFQVSLPSHLSPTAFPLSQTPTPQDLQFFTLSVGGRRVLFTEDDPRSLSVSGSSSADRVREGWELEGRGKGWTRVRNEDELQAEKWEGLERVGLGSALGAFASSSTARGGSSSNVGQRRTTPLAVTPPEPSPPASSIIGKGKEREVLPAPLGVPPPTFHPLATSPSTSRTSRPDSSPASHHPLGQHQRQLSTGGSSSPPRKRQRDGGVATADEADDDAMAVDHPSPTSLAPPTEDPNTTTTTTTTVMQSYPPSSGPPSSVHQPTIGSGLDLALLQSLPHLLKSFDALPPKLADHFLLHCLRRSTLPTLQRVSSFISPALKFDFVLHFPVEIAIAIFSFLPRSGLANAARVSRKWNEMVDCQRGVWVARLEHDGLWWGLGAEEEEEEKVRQRWEVKDRLQDEARREEEKERPLGTPQETSGSPLSPSSWNALNHPGGSEGRKRRSHPLKQVYRMRYMTKKNWTRPKPAGRRFMFHGHGAHVVTCLQFDTDKIVSASDDVRLLFLAFCACPPMYPSS